MPTALLSTMQKVELLKRVADNPSIPSPPSVVLRVLDCAGKPDCTIGELCKIIQTDPGLTGNILRIVNSAIFGLSRPATSIQRALTVVGLNSARLLVLTISFPRLQESLRIDPGVKERYWKSAIAGAIVARALAQHVNSPDPEDDMAAGLLRDLGEMVMHQVFPAQYPEILKTPGRALIREQCEMEVTQCGVNHAEVSAYLLHRWRLPTDVTDAVRYHHNPDQGAFATDVACRRAYVLHFASHAAQMLLSPDEPTVLDAMYTLAADRFQMDAATVHEFLAPLGQKVADLAGVLQVDIGADVDFHARLTRAGTALVDLSLGVNQANQRALDMKRQAESEARRWRQEAVFDPLTKVFNRRFLESRLGELLDRTSDACASFGILFIDLDGFKAINDRCGHRFGDYVLQQVADRLNRAIRQGDVVARYGGDEFCIVFVPADERVVQVLADRIWKEISPLTVKQTPHEGTIGASIGAVHCDPRSAWTTPQALVEAADRAMYQAKSRGKNRVVFLGTLSGILRNNASGT